MPLPSALQPWSSDEASATRRPAQASNDEDITLMVDERGVVQHCSGALDDLFGYAHDELVQQHVSLLLPQWADLALLEHGRPNSRLLYLCRIGGYFRARSRSGALIPIDVFPSDLGANAPARLRVMIRPSGPR